VTAAQLESLRGQADAEAGFTEDLYEVAAIRTLVLRAVTVEMQLPRTHRESVDLMRIGAREVDANPDGIDLDGPMIEALSATAMLTRDSLADPTTEAFRSGETMMAETYGSAPAFLWINTPGNSRQEQLVAGRRYVRMNLAATAAGLSMHPMSQSLQEYPEMAPILAGVHALLAPGGERVQMLARIGHGAAVPPAPRWPLEAKLLPGA
jgi:lambda repressor-like predicted transcriptional regulator